MPLGDSITQGITSGVPDEEFQVSYRKALYDRLKMAGYVVNNEIFVGNLISGESVGRLFAGGVFPGLLLLVLVSSYIAIRCYFQPRLGPALPREERGDWKRKITALKAVILPINDDLAQAADELRGQLAKAGLRIAVDTRTESLNKKIREAQLANIPLILTFGAKEMESGNLSVRTLDGKVKLGVSRETFLDVIKGHIARRELELNPEFDE